MDGAQSCLTADTSLVDCVSNKVLMSPRKLSKDDDVEKYHSIKDDPLSIQSHPTVSIVNSMGNDKNGMSMLQILA